MKQFFSAKVLSIIVAVAVVGSAFGLGTFVGARNTASALEANPSILNGSAGKNTTVDFAPFWKVWSILHEKYVPTTSKTASSTSDQQNLWGAIAGLTASYGDPYTVFFPPAENKEFQTQISGNFEGVGMEVGIKDNVLTVIAPLKNAPADKAGIKSGDRIVAIDGTSTAAMSVDTAVSLMRGKKGTSVTLSIVPKDAKDAKSITIVRDVIDIPTIDTEKRSDGVFVIRLYSFTGSSAALFKNAIQEFVQSGSSKLVLDLRGNPGGYLEAAVDMASWFLPKDALVVRESSNGRGIEQDYKSVGYNIFNKNLKMVILVDGGSASASEILAGALNEYGVAKLVGTKTYGKGSVQELINITPETALKVTVARWLTPKGNTISEQGLKPDVVVEFTAEDAKAGRDPQFIKALEVVKAQ